MPLTILSPFSGRPVKVRDQDVGRAVRDEEGRIFYVVEKADGGGYYAAPTRKGSEKDEQRYADLETRTDLRAAQVQKEHAAVFDATGPGRKAGQARLVWLLIVLLLTAAGAYVAIRGVDAIPFLQPEDAGPHAPPTQAFPERLETPPAQTPSGMLHPLPDQPEVRIRPEVLALMMSTRPPDEPQDRAPASVVATDPTPVPAHPPASTRSAITHNPSPRAPRPATDPRQAVADPLEIARQRIIESLDKAKPFVKNASGLRYRIDQAGTGQRARAGRFVLIHYTVAHYKPGGPAKLIDSSRQDNKPLGFVLWSGQVIRGWDEGIAGMREGERRTLIIPTSLAASARQATAHGDLPHTNLLCEIELIEVRPGVAHLVERVGSGKLAYPGQTIEFHYTATITGQDKPFDDSYHYGQPLRITIGDGDVIQGLELGLTGMAVGETRSIEIPSYLAYGSRGAGALIPPHSDLSYTVELLRIIED